MCKFNHNIYTLLVIAQHPWNYFLRVVDCNGILNEVGIPQF